MWGRGHACIFPESTAHPSTTVQRTEAHTTGVVPSAHHGQDGGEEENLINLED